MEEKKTPKANLENKRGIFFLLGLVVVLSTLFVVFEWNTEESLSPDWENLSPLFIEEELIALNTPATEIETEEVPKPVAEPIGAEESDPEDFNITDSISEEIETKQDTVLNLNQNKEEEILKEEEVILSEQAETMPLFEGGYVELIRFIYTHLKYPEIALQKRIEGKVWCSFIVNKNGSISDVRLEQGVSIYLDDEAIRVLRSMPPWQPAIQKEQPVRVRIYLPIVFKL